MLACATSGPQITEVIISDLKVLDTNVKAAAAWSIQENLQVKDKIFGDRVYLIEDVPRVFVGLDWVRSACDSKNFAGDTLVLFKVLTDASVMVAYDDRVIQKPAWFSGWTDTKEDLIITGSPPLVMSVFSKQFPAGSTVSLGPNGQSGGCVQYVVIVKGPGVRVPRTTSTSTPAKVEFPPLTWKGATTMPDEWFKTAEAARVGDNVLLYQRNTGGFPKNLDMATVLSPAEVEMLKRDKILVDSTIDNMATIYEITYLAKLGTISGVERFKAGALAGIDFLLVAQYPKGGWPQVYPLAKGDYSVCITYNDNAMINVMNLFTQVMKNSPEFAFVDSDRRARIKTSLDKGLQCILATQVRNNGIPTVWCAQHDPVTLQPATARTYELPSLSGSESVGIVQYLMQIENPAPEVIASIQGAVAWFDKVRITGIRLVEKRDPALPQGRDMVVEKDPAAPPIWGRFHDLNTYKAFFVGRDGVKKPTLAEIEHERRIGYSYYTYAPGYLIEKLYPAWQARHAPGKNVLAK